MEPIAIVDYDAGNLASVCHALDRLGASYRISNDHEVLNASSGLIFPGVGHARAAMDSLRRNGLVEILQNYTKPLLGICLGMQLLFEHHQEGNVHGLGLIEGDLTPFPKTDLKVPHMGWNSFHTLSNHLLIKGLQTNDFFYYVHSYFAPVVPQSIGTCEYGTPFTSIVAQKNVMGVQFHPEKSGANGHQLLSNFLTIVSQHV